MAKKTGPPRYGKNEHEKSIMEFIVFQRKKKKTWPDIVDNLHARAMYPRRAFRWTEILCYHVYKRATEGGFET